MYCSSYILDVSGSIGEMHLSGYFSISWQSCWSHSFILFYCCPLMISSHCSTYTLASVIVEWARPCPSGHGCVQWTRVCPSGRVVPSGPGCVHVGPIVSKWARVCPGQFRCIIYASDLLCLSFYCRYLALLASDADLSAF